MEDCKKCEHLKVTRMIREDDRYVFGDKIRHLCWSEDNKYFEWPVNNIPDHECKDFWSVGGVSYQPDKTTSKPMPR